MTLLSVLLVMIEYMMLGVVFTHSTAMFGVMLIVMVLFYWETAYPNIVK